MKRIGLIIFLTLTFALTLNITAQESRRSENEREHSYNDDRNSSRSIKGELFIKLEKLERDFSRQLGRRERAELKFQIDDIKALIRQLPPEPVYIPEPMNEIEFKELYNSVRKQHFKDQKIQIIKASVGYNFFTIEQVITLANTTNFGDERLEIIILLYPRIINYSKTFQLYECLIFDSEKKKLEEFINQFNSRQNDRKDRYEPNQRP
jgi:hypothetical protein